jgi:predicted ATPase
MEASGYRKFGLLAALIRNEQLRTGSTLFWDEPENSLNPELVPVMVDILLELSKSGVQVFLATHDYNIARYLDVRKDRSVPVVFHNLTKANGGIVCESSPEYLK